ncbi:interleukin-1 family member 10 isoform X1 [Prionailurus viverrinus]|uniref:interleukin-1 family member 10 isoform X1 n=1 Tax=Prionailurus viverrinus TaxID=61388 RepID=UPI001FF34669|nr:interleukin-1 family member 10 isoform X1 [Prionailurus viverrinus]
MLFFSILSLCSSRGRRGWWCVRKWLQLRRLKNGQAGMSYILRPEIPLKSKMLVSTHMERFSRRINKDQSPRIAGMCSLPMARYYTIKDADQKALYLRGDQLLVGDPSADDCCAEKICILPNRGLDRTKVPIFLGLQGGSRCLACVETEEGPSLQLEDVNIEDLYKGGEQATRFTFFQRSLGSAFRLEAAAWPGWFLCGPAEPQQPVRLAKESEPLACTEFYFEQSR